MDNNGNSFLLNNQSTAAAMSALHAAANMIEKSPSSIHSNQLPFYPYVTPATLHSNHHQTPQVSSNSPQHQMATSIATPFGINDILSRTAAVGISGVNFHGNSTPSIEDFKFNQTTAPVTMATMGGNFGGRRAAAAVAAAMILNNHHGRSIEAHGNGGMGQGVHTNPMKFGKPLTDLPGRPPIYWPGVLTEDWHEQMGMHG